MFLFSQFEHGMIHLNFGERHIILNSAWTV